MRKRRDFIKSTALGASAIFAVPTIVPSTVFGKNAPSNKINIGQIGFGRIARSHDLPETMKYDEARIIAVSDVDSRRAADGKAFIEKYYADQKGSENYVDVNVYGNYGEMLEDPEIDAVIVSTPDHWHAKPAIDAAMAGKDIYLQKPASLTITEGRMMSDAIHRSGRVFQCGSQQRSLDPWPQFHRACELVRNGRIGKITEVIIGLPGDPSGEDEPEMDVPVNLDYEMWLGSTEMVYYTERRVHPQDGGYSRPGWLRCEQFGAGMITGWGAHHIDTAHWGMGTEYTGPIEVEAEASFPTSGLWNVHGDFNVTAKYANGAVMKISGENTNGVKFIGEDGWIFVARGKPVTSSDPTSGNEATKSLDASDPKSWIQKSRMEK